MFGFDTAVVSGTVDSLRAKFDLNSLLEGWVVSSALLGCISGAFLGLMLAIPESPRWLARQGRTDEAVSLLSNVLERSEGAGNRRVDGSAGLRGGQFSRTVPAGHPHGTADRHAAAFLFAGDRHQYQYLLWDFDFKNVGLGIELAIAAQVIIGLINMVFTLLAIWEVDQLGRKPLLLIWRKVPETKCRSLEEIGRFWDIC